MAVIAGLWVIMALIFASIGLLFFFAVKRDWFCWEWVTPQELAGSVFSGPKANFVLMVTRIFCFLFSLIILIIILATATAGQSFEYYTVWNFTLLIVFFLCASVHSVREMFHGWRLSATPNPRFFDKLTVILYHICLTMVLMVDIVLWTILYPQAKKAHEEHPTRNPNPNPNEDDDYVECCTQFTNFFSVVVHGLNFFMMLSELIQNRIRFSIANCLWLLIWMSSYAIFQWFFALSPNGRWVYFFMDTTTESAAAWYPGLFILHIVFFFIVFGFSKLKEKRAGLHGDTAAEQQYLVSHNYPTKDTSDILARTSSMA
eukprot:m.34921 g.34921  ORF g.34921 m.34921 type:complete len:316 (+) comp9966_c2_seq1:33-980(+)